MIKFILNNQDIKTDLPAGLTVLDFVRYRQNLKGTKIGCREGDCGACTVLVGELTGDEVKYRTQTSCLMPLANARNKHIVTVEGINRPDGELTPVQQALVDESGTQCGFCTVGFVMSLTNFCIDGTSKTAESAISAIDGNICRCTGYKSIERAAERLADAAHHLTPSAATNGLGQEHMSEPSAVADGLSRAIQNEVVPDYFRSIKDRLEQMVEPFELNRPLPQAVLTRFVGGGTDLYVQKPEEMVVEDAANLFDDRDLRFIRETDGFVEIGASNVVTDLLESPVMNRLFPDLYKHLKLVSSTPIRNMATLAGNFVNASPIGDMTIWFLALNAEIELSRLSAEGFGGQSRIVPLRDFYLGYKQLARSEDEIITSISFRKDFTHFNFEKVCKRTYLDIASVNTAISLRLEPAGAFSRPALMAGGTPALQSGGQILDAHVSVGGVAPIPLYLRETSEFLRGREISEETILQANEMLQTEISPISDVRGSAGYKRLLARQLFKAHFVDRIVGSE